jgi:glycosyltransferase involved in cell wall biosynthesis
VGLAGFSACFALIELRPYTENKDFRIQPGLTLTRPAIVTYVSASQSKGAAGSMRAETLVYVASNRKGDELYKALRQHFDESFYIYAGYGSLPRLLRILPRVLNKVGSSVRNSVRIDCRLRAVLSARAFKEGASIASRNWGRTTHFVHWHNLFPITDQWRALGPASLITDVAMNSQYFEHFRISSQGARALRKRIREISVQNATYVFTHSNWAADANRQLYPEHVDKIRQIGWGSDMPPLSREEALNSQRDLQIISIGHDYRRKGVDFYDQVAGRLKDLVPGLQCLIAGKPGRFDIRALQHLTVLGPLPRPRLAEMLKQSSLFMLFSRLEPAGHVTIEAMSYGLPVICSAQGGIAEPIREGVTGFVCADGSVDSVVQNAFRLLTEPLLMAQFRKNAYEHATTRWQWNHAAERLVAHLNSKPITEQSPDRSGQALLSYRPDGASSPS